ncbi:DUF177 domain-containing protein [Candidatus Poribacteria bacterium]|nr:DUF177 domain-containing protein [Candidatus Poribacteria bacterium]
MKALEFIVKEMPENVFDFHEIQVPPLELDLEAEDTHVGGPIYSRLQLLRTDQNVYINADFSTSVTVGCRRCLESFETDIKAEMELYFSPANKSEKSDVSLGDTGERHYSGDIIDFSEEARQALVLEIPVWPLCSESCEGLCPQCGQNLNVAECRCHERKPEGSSSPFAALANMLNTSDSTVEAADLAEDKSTNHSQAYQSMNHIILRR